MEDGSRASQERGATGSSVLDIAEWGVRLIASE
jgi:hypothetical protein